MWSLDATSVAANIFSATPTNLFDNIVEMIENGLTPSDLADTASAYPTGYNSKTNVLNVQVKASKIAEYQV